MLIRLSLNNIAIIESLTVDLGPGLTVITGETGAGKSILLDALVLVFGAKASPKEVMRSGSVRAGVELAFDRARIPNPETVEALLQAAGVELSESEGEILLSRDWTPSGSRFRINGVPVTREVLTALRPQVLDLHGQHELTSLFDAASQRTYLDHFGGRELLAARSRVKAVYMEWQGLRQQLEALRQRQADWQQQRDFLEFQWRELSEANLTDAEEDIRAQAELKVLSHAERLIQASTQAASQLSEDTVEVPSVLSRLGQIQKSLSGVLEVDTRLDSLYQRLDGACETLKEISGELIAYPESIEYRPERMGELIERLDLLERLKRKYGPNLSGVLETRDTLEARLQQEAQAQGNLDQLEAALTEAETRLSEVSLILTRLRQKAAESLKERLIDQLGELQMPGVQFDVCFEPGPYTGEGAETLTFLFSANPGEPLRPLAKVASGGELSRFLLALKVLIATSDGVKTLVFDEIDTGISGPTARAVAEKLAALGSALQVLVITHQPMVAAMGDRHLHVCKAMDEASERVAVSILDLQDERGRLSMLSRLVGGVDTLDEATERFVARLMEQARAWKEAHGKLPSGAGCLVERSG